MKNFTPLTENAVVCYYVNACALSVPYRVFVTVNYTHSATKEVFFDNIAKITLISL